jgi:phosphatidylglycerol:prolipoprotein diacylglycerol transferase
VFSRRGFVFHGGFLSAAIAGFIFLRKRGISFWKIGDLVSPGLSLGYAIARIGCFLNGCCYGKCTNSPLGIKFPDDALCYITSSMAPVPIHPTQLYSFFSSIVIFVILLMLRKRARFQGEVFVNYILLYSTYRFTIEFLRADYPDLFLSLTLPQLISIAFFGLSLGYFLYKRRIGS